ncbi:regulatory protein GemA [Rhodoplanes sp. TEM]|uniref:Regulatory protein GemA n=1 Tax=Rhodoplanes tepidamans TaxID=200616 RepID=A0ABT5JFC5_RHOTP|nr:MULTISPECIES: regulatory protein GemA [Rhodoplanes]MDC7787999.1 regulatory protein GemA [Rhodoplanes tepidamans]MDC7984839.1 regulatory protein GemA [Rhodoplanes sp. TEM]MDQ0358428.1 hypothetical protein [Rhodoplanes tepidamans]
MTAAAPTSGPASSRQIGAMHALKARLGLDDAAYRDLIEGLTGQRSARALTGAQAGVVIDHLKVLSGQRPNVPRTAFESGLPATLPASLAPEPLAKGALTIDGPYGAKLRALWIAAHDLGVVRDRTDVALVRFVERQTKIAHPRWLRDAADAMKAIEALKGWIAREGGVDWPARDKQQTNEQHAAEVKRAVITAQWLGLVKLGAVRVYIAARPLESLDGYALKVAGRPGWAQFQPHDYAVVQAALGRKLRKALAGRAKP